MSQSLVSLPGHFVFSTRGREPRIDPAWAVDLYAYIGGAVRQEGCSLLAAGGVADHVHLLVSLGRVTACAGLMRVVKANSSRWAAERSPGFGWQGGYAGFAVGWDGLARVTGYIGDQERRHVRQTFQDELRHMLRVHGVQWDERYV